MHNSQTTIRLLKLHPIHPFSILALRRWDKRTILIVGSVAVMVLIQNSAYSLISPFFPPEAEDKGVSSTVVGLIFGSYELVIFATSPIYGSIVSTTA